MHLKHEFCDDCPGCRPALLNPKTGKILPKDHPIMVAITHIWDTQTTYEERKAFIDTTYNNTRTEKDLALARNIRNKFQARLHELEKEQSECQTS